MLNNGSLSCTYDSANRLLTAGGNTYTYNAEDVRIKNVHYGVEEKYTYNTNCKLSKMLTRTVGTTVTKYVYGLGLISEETNNTVKVYHFDYRGSTVVVTDSTGAITDTFEYDTYGKVIARAGTSDIIFCYNGRDGVVTDTNGLFYMRARYYSSDMRRFVNADILAGAISEAITLNRYAYANGNPVSNIDPFGLSVLVTIGIMVIGGVVSAAVQSSLSIVEQQVTKGEVNWAEVFSDAAWGFVDGAITSSPVGIVGKTALTVVVSIGSQLTEVYIYSENKDDMKWLLEMDAYDVAEIAVNTGIDAVFAYRSGPGLNYKKNKTLSYERLNQKVIRESRRANEKIRVKRTDIAKAGKRKILFYDTIDNIVLPTSDSVLQEVSSNASNVFFARVGESQDMRK